MMEKVVCEKRVCPESPICTSEKHSDNKHNNHNTTNEPKRIDAVEKQFVKQSIMKTQNFDGAMLNKSEVSMLNKSENKLYFDGTMLNKFDNKQNFDVPMLHKTENKQNFDGSILNKSENKQYLSFTSTKSKGEQNLFTEKSTILSSEISTEKFSYTEKSTNLVSKLNELLKSSITPARGAFNSVCEYPKPTKTFNPPCEYNKTLNSAIADNHKTSKTKPIEAIQTDHHNTIKKDHEPLKTGPNPLLDPLKIDPTPLKPDLNPYDNKAHLLWNLDDAFLCGSYSTRRRLQMDSKTDSDVSEGNKTLKTLTFSEGESKENRRQ